MSCGFWLKRKKRNAMLQERAKAEAVVSKEEVVDEKSSVSVSEKETVKKPTKKAVKTDDNETTV